MSQTNELHMTTTNEPVPFSVGKGNFATTEIVEFNFDTYQESEDLDGCFELLLEKKNEEMDSDVAHMHH